MVKHVNMGDKIPRNIFFKGKILHDAVCGNFLKIKRIGAGETGIVRIFKTREIKTDIPHFQRNEQIFRLAMYRILCADK